MPAVTRRGVDKSAGACGKPPTVPKVGSPNVFANKKNLVRTGDAYIPHPHGRVAIGKANEVYANRRLVHRLGDPISCKDKGAQGSPDVFAGS